LLIQTQIVAGKLKGFSIAMFINIDKKHADEFLQRALTPDMRNTMDWFVEMPFTFFRPILASASLLHAFSFLFTCI
jgi:hypothetical protein